MAHDLATTRNGQHAFASLRQPGWHNLGTVLPDEVTGPEMLRAAGIDYKVATAPIKFRPTVEMGDVSGNGDYAYTVGDEQEVPNSKIVYRTDTGASLGIVGNEYELFQNAEMIEFFEGLVDEKKITYETAGALGAGETAWVLARIPDLSLDILGDQINSYMCIRTGHIGNMCLHIHPTTIRVVCANTMAAASASFLTARKKHGLNTINAGFSIRHKRNMRTAVLAVQSAYGKCIQDLHRTKELMEFLAKTTVTAEMVKDFTDFFVDPTKDEKERAEELSKRAETRMDNRREVFNTVLASATNQTVATKGTVFGLLSAGVEVIDHERATRRVGDKSEDMARFESAMFGQGSALKAKLLDRALVLAGA
jgi:phage/plasmid-like protein (TIGR03299 family)